jgi:hypothetical protein
MIRRPGVVVGLTILASIVAIGIAPGRQVAAAVLPPRLAADAFWRLVADLSEPGGYFRSDVFLSNEETFQNVIPELKKTLPTGGVYLGVGPEQNFTYIAALQPRLAFIIDIRRQNMLEHLLYKSLFERSTDRADFLSHLFSRKRPPGLNATSTVDALFAAYSGVAPSKELFHENVDAARQWLVKRHGFGLSNTDLRTIEYVYNAFFDGGPAIEYSFVPGSQRGYGFFPSYAELMTTSDARGDHSSYLATEASYRSVKQLHENNLIVPVVGDFSGGKAVRAVGQYMKDHHVVVTAFYTSNVEQYLFQDPDAWKRFLANVATLPIDDRSTIIRALARGYAYPPSPSGVRGRTRLYAIADLVKAFHGGRIASYADVIVKSK